MTEKLKMRELFEPLATRPGLQRFYREQLSKFHKIGYTNYTEFGVQITDTLMNATQRRLNELMTL